MAINKTLMLTIVALVAFAANSILCRLALKDGAIDAVSFTQIRLMSGALFLAPFFYVRRKSLLPFTLADVPAATALFVYAITFSLSYITLGAGVGALILFGTVQFTMIGAGYVQGERPGPGQLGGVALAFAGLVYLLLPGLSAPPWQGALLMGVAGLAWGAYSLFGKGAKDPVGATARNFMLTVPAIFLLLLWPHQAHFSTEGVVLAISSGAIASGAGYVIWYRALKGLASLSASVVQLAVPAIATLGGVVFIGETITLRFVIATVLILGGIYLAIRRKKVA